MKYTIVVLSLFVAGCTQSLKNPKYEKDIHSVKAQIQVLNQRTLSIEEQTTQKLEVELDRLYKEVMQTRKMVGEVNQKLFKLYQHLGAVEYKDKKGG